MIHNVPDEMKSFKQWVVWKHEDKGDDKLTKVPYSVNTGGFASVIDESTWASFEDCQKASGSYDGVGFVLTAEDPYTIVDLDHTTDPTHVEKQIKIAESLDSYSEVSPSGKGLHIVVKAKLSQGRRRGPFELYSSRRFMTMTGDVYQRKPIQWSQANVEGILDMLGLLNTFSKLTSQINEPQINDDLQVYNTASAASNGEKFLGLWGGDFHTWHFGDQSRADFALVDIISFYTKNREQVKRLFLQSGLGRRAKAKRADYMNSMINRSFDNAVPFIDFSNLVVPTSIAVSKIVVKPAETYKKEGPLSMPPGLTGEIADFIYKQSYKPVPEMSIVAALGLMAGLNGRAFNVSGTGLNLYLLLLARTGRGKEEMAKGVAKISSALQMMCPSVDDFFGPGDLASGQALLRYLSDHKTGSFLSIFGEFGIKLKSICKPNALASDLMLQKILLDLYSKSGATDKMMPTAYSDAERNTKIIHSPAVTIIGESTPDWFFENIDESMINSGLLPRFSVVEYLGLRPPSNHVGRSVTPNTQMIEKIATLISVSQGLLQARQRCNVTFDDDAQRMSQDLDTRGDDEINSKSSGLSEELWNRAHLKAMKIAALLAVGKNPYVPVIDAECFTWAQNFVVREVEAMKVRFDSGHVGGTQESRQLQLITKLLSAYLVKRPVSGHISEEMYANFTIPLAYIFSVLRIKKPFKDDRSGATAAIRRLIATLEESGELMKVPPMQSQSMFGLPGKFYVIGQLNDID